MGIQKGIVLILIFIWATVLKGQSSALSLEECIEIAEENNLTVKNQWLNVERSKITQKLANRMSLPRVDASTSYGYNFGFAIDPTTNDFANQTSSILNGGLDAQMNLFQFGRIRTEQKIGDLNVLASETDWKQEKRNIRLSIANAYLQTVLQGELLENTKRNKALTEVQVQRMEKLLNAGSIAETELLNIKAQLAQDEQAEINAQNSFDMSRLQLQLIMLYPEDFKPIVPDLNQWENQDPYIAISREEIMSGAMSNDWRIKAAELREVISEHQIKVNDKSRLPSVLLFGNVNTRYSSLAQQVNGEKITSVSTEFTINNQPVTAVQEVSIPTFEETPLNDQLRNNLGQFVGVSLNVPIYNRYQFQSRIDEARVEEERSRINTQIVRQQLKQEVGEAYQNYLNTRASVEASQKTFEALELALKNATVAFEYGTINTFEYNQSRTQRDNAQSNLLRDQYNYLFAIKVLDYYLGVELHEK